MGISGDMFLIIIVSIAAVIVLEIAFGHFWGLQYEYPHSFSFKKYFAFLANEFNHKTAGDKRCEFEKLTERCQILESSRIIHNPGKCSNHNHQHS